MSKKAPKNKLGQPPTRRSPRRSSTLRSKPLSTMPKSKSGTHTVYTRVANLQMSKARQEKIRDALATQLQRCNEEIERLEDESRALLARIGVAERDKPATTKSVKRVFSDFRTDTDDGPEPSPRSEGDEGFHYKY